MCEQYEFGKALLPIHVYYECECILCSFYRLYYILMLIKYLPTHLIKKTFSRISVIICVNMIRIHISFTEKNRF